MKVDRLERSDMRAAYVALFFSLFLPVTVLGQGYKCVGADGKVSFQQQPCARNSTQSPLPGVSGTQGGGRVQVHSEERNRSVELASGKFVWFVDKSTIAIVGRFKRARIIVERNGEPDGVPYYRYYDCSKPGKRVSLPIYVTSPGHLSEADAHFRDMKGEEIGLWDRGDGDEQLSAGYVICGGSGPAVSATPAVGSDWSPTVQRTLDRGAAERYKRALDEAGVEYTLRTDGPGAYVFSINRRTLERHKSEPSIVEFEESLGKQ